MQYSPHAKKATHSPQAMDVALITKGHSSPSDLMQYNTEFINSLRTTSIEAERLLHRTHRSKLHGHTIGGLNATFLSWWNFFIFSVYHKVKLKQTECWRIPPGKVRSKTTGDHKVPLQLNIRGTFQCLGRAPTENAFWSTWRQMGLVWIIYNV